MSIRKYFETFLCLACVMAFAVLEGVAVPIGAGAPKELAVLAGIPGEETYRAYEPSNGWTRVDYVLRPTTNSYIRCRLILPPKERWTGRFWGLGNSSEGGRVWHNPSYAQRGDASVHCDLGTSEGRHYLFPEVFDDYGWRATHLMTVTGKALTEAFYGRKIIHSYYHGASTGGNQGMREAMDFPEDYDGIAVEVPAFPRVSMCALYWWIERAVRDESGKRVVTEAQCKAMAEAALEWFADKDEPYARGRFLTNPRYTPEAERGIYALAEKRCAELKSADVRARWHAIFTGPVINGRRAHAGYAFGADLTMLAKRHNYNLAWLVGKKFNVFKVSPETIEAYARRFAPQINAEKEDLSVFAARGGKLLVMPGIEDEYIPVSSAIDWYERVTDRMGGFDRTKTFCRMFLLPGRAHAKGRGMDNPKNIEDKLVEWVERGVAPERLDSGSDYPIAAYPDKIGGLKELGWTVKPYDRSDLPRVDPLYLHGVNVLSTGVGGARGASIVSRPSTAFAETKDTPAVAPDVKGWHGANLLGLFNAAPQKPDRRVRGHFEECYFRWMKDWGFNFARLPARKADAPPALADARWIGAVRLSASVPPGISATLQLPDGMSHGLKNSFSILYKHENEKGK